MLGIAAFPGETEPRFVEAAEPRAPSESQVLCRTLALGICGTDRDILESARPMKPLADSFLVLGHECLARIEAVGRGVTEFAPGDLVVPVVRRAFDRSHPRPDMLPFGSFTERGIWEEHGFSLPQWLDEPRYLFRVEPEIANVAVLTEPLSVAEKGINEAAAIQRGRLGSEAWANAAPRVLVTGQGPIAFACLIAGACRGWPMTQLGRDAPTTTRARLAQRFGAKYVSFANFATEPHTVERDGFDLILECTGSDEVMVQTARWLATCGVMVWLGSSRLPRPRSHNLDITMRDAILRNHVHLGTVNAAPRDFADALAHLRQLQRTHPRDLAEVITARVSPQDALWHYRHREPQGIKTVVMFE